MTRPSLVTVAAIASSFALFAACAEQPATTPPIAPTGAASVAVALAPTASAPAPGPDPATPPGPGDWGTWSHERKMGYMKAVVMNKMGGAFHDLDGARYASPKCTLCHSAGAKDGSFKMPDADLPKLPANPADFKTLAAKSPKVFDFMVKTVVPQTAALLGQQPYDPATKAGFGCFGCHTKG